MITAAITSRLVRGVAEIEPVERGLRLHRLPTWVRRQYPDPQLLSMETQPSGVRLVFRTSAAIVELETHSTRIAYAGADRARGCLDVFVNGDRISRDELRGGDVTEVDLATGTASFLPGLAHTTTLAGLPAGTNRIEIWLPHNESVDLVELRADAPIADDPGVAPRWVHHGQLDQSRLERQRPQ